MDASWQPKPDQKSIFSWKRRKTKNAYKTNIFLMIFEVSGRGKSIKKTIQNRLKNWSEKWSTKWSILGATLGQILDAKTGPRQAQEAAKMAKTAPRGRQDVPRDGQDDANRVQKNRVPLFFFGIGRQEPPRAPRDPSKRDFWSIFD